MQGVKFENGKLLIIDQTLLPNEEKIIHIKSLRQARDAITRLAVRGAPSIGIFAAYAAAIFSDGDNIKAVKKYLDSARPTAVNLSAATQRIADAYESGDDVIKQAKMFEQENTQMCLKISEYGLSLLHDGDGILTHCNAGELAAGRYGTGLGPIVLGTERGYSFRVYCDETRPLLQGARLTSYELERCGADVTLICDNMAGWAMQQGLINAVLVGCDRVAANGDTANKIGTSSVAVLAAHYGIPFYVLGPCTTIDFTCKSGRDINIEMRGGDEIKELYFEKPTALSHTKCLNPSFDVTDADLITAIITDRGIIRPPFEENLRRYCYD